MAFEKLKFPYEAFAEKLQELGISRKQAIELAFHLLEFNDFTNKFNSSIHEIITLNKQENSKVKELLDDLWGELETHIITNPLLPAKNILEKITEKL